MSKIKVAFWDELMRQQEEEENDEGQENAGDSGRDQAGV